MNRPNTIVLSVLAGLICAGAGFAQQVANLKIVSGNGQAICPNCSSNVVGFFGPLVVQAVDANGAPVAGASVTWTINSVGTFTIFDNSSTSFTTTTDSNGLSQIRIIPNLFGNGGFFASYLQSAITASAGSASATFYETQGLQDQSNQNIQPITGSFATLADTLFPGFNFSGQVGTLSSTPIRVKVLGQNQLGIPNVAVGLVNDQTSTTGPIATCDTPANSPAGPGIVLTDANGLAVCTPRFGGVPVPGVTGHFHVDIGGIPLDDGLDDSPTYVRLPAGGGFNLIVTPGVPGSITKVSGDTQTVTSGQQVPNPLVVQVNGTNGQPLGGITVTWKVSPANAATLSSTSTVTDTSGRSSITLQLAGNVSGAVQVTATLASDTTKSVTFTINTTQPVVLTGFSLVSGNNQSAIPNAAFGQPLVVAVTNSLGPAANVQVQFQVVSGSAVLSATTATTDANGRAQVTVQAGSTQGPVTIQASIPGNVAIGTQTFNLTVLPPGPTITAANFVNGADFQVNSLSPCSVGAIVANAGSLGLTTLSSNFLGLPLPVSNTVNLTMNNVSAPILNIGQNQLGKQVVLFQVPCSVTPGNVPVTLNVGGGTGNLTLNVQPASPGIFQTVMSDGIARAILVRPDGTFVSLENPARRGETVVAYVTGLGATTQTVGTSALPVPHGAPSMVSGDVIVGLNGGGAPLTYAQLSEDLPGVYLVAFEIPSDTPASNDVSFSVGVIPVGSTTAYYSGLTTIPVR